MACNTHNTSAAAHIHSMHYSGFAPSFMHRFSWPNSPNQCIQCDVHKRMCVCDRSQKHNTLFPPYAVCMCFGYPPPHFSRQLKNGLFPWNNSAKQFWLRNVVCTDSLNRLHKLNGHLNLRFPHQSPCRPRCCTDVWKDKDFPLRVWWQSGSFNLVSIF